jgi:broad specificity phosphatase PhoE
MDRRSRAGGEKRRERSYKPGRAKTNRSAVAARVAGGATFRVLAMLLVRHAESEWNRRFGASRVDPGLPDPPLTERGVAEARAAAELLRREGIRRLLASPYRRALQTARILAEELGLPVAVEPLVRERCAFSCDQGSHPERLRAEWPEFDFSGLEPVWWGGMMESVASLEARARRFLAFAERLDEPETVAVITHWGFIRCLTGREVGNLGAVRLRLDRPAGPVPWAGDQHQTRSGR